MAKMTPEGLALMQQYPFHSKILTTQTRIFEMMYRTGYKIAVAFSGGKDSAVLLDIVAGVWAAEGPRHGNKPLVVVFANTGMEHAGMSSFVKDYCFFMEQRHGITIDLHIAKPAQSFCEVVANEGYPIASKMVARRVLDIRKWLDREQVNWKDINKLLKKDGKTMDFLKTLNCPDGVVLYLTGINSKKESSPNFFLPKKWWCLIDAPFRVSHICCDILKKHPIIAIQDEMGLSPLIGEMAADSQNRRAAYLKTGCNSFEDGKGKSKPMGFWLEQDTLRYIRDYQLPLFKVYGSIENCEGSYHCTGEDRTGCKLCMFGIGISGENERFKRLRILEPQAIDYAWKPLDKGGLGYGQVVDYLNEHTKLNIQV